LLESLDGRQALEEKIKERRACAPAAQGKETPRDTPFLESKLKSVPKKKSQVATRLGADKVAYEGNRELEKKEGKDVTDCKGIESDYK